MPLDPFCLASLLALPPTHPLIRSSLASLDLSTFSSSTGPPKAKVSTYPDVEFHSYPSLGLCLTYTPSPPGESRLDRLDVYNPPSPSSSSSASIHSNSTSHSSASSPRPQRKKKTETDTYSPPSFPVTFHFPSTSLPLPPQQPPSSAAPSANPSGPSTESEKKRPSTISRPGFFDVDAKTTGRDFVKHFGEPSRKGGGEGWIAPWLEWGRVGILRAPTTDRFQAGRVPGGSCGQSSSGDCSGKARVEDVTGTQEGGGEGVGLRFGRQAVADSLDTGAELTDIPESGREEAILGRGEVVFIGVLVELRDSGREPNEEERRKGLGGLWDRAAEWEWEVMKVFGPDGLGR